jgi:ubiquinone/menaquinone biosynthesis C-methylase UbiE
MPLAQESNMPQTPETSSNAAQIEYWNTTAGETWAQFQETLDRQVERLGLAAMDALSPRESEHIIDIGCGCGQTSLALAARVQPTGSVVGVDISKPMLDVALRRPRSTDLQVVFRKLDAQTDDLGQGLFDAAFSRFGVMFFGDPVAAFANIRASLKPEGRPFCLLAKSQRESLDAGPAASRTSTPTTRGAARSHSAWTVCVR